MSFKGHPMPMRGAISGALQAPSSGALQAPFNVRLSHHSDVVQVPLEMPFSSVIRGAIGGAICSTVQAPQEVPLEAPFIHHWKHHSGAVCNSISSDRRSVILVLLLYHFGASIALLFLQIFGQRRRCKPCPPYTANAAWRSVILTPFLVIRKTFWHHSLVGNAVLVPRVGQLPNDAVIESFRWWRRRLAVLHSCRRRSRTTSATLLVSLQE